MMGQWFYLHFTENPGMAFGITIPGVSGKLALSIFRLFAIGFIVYYIRLLQQRDAHKGLLVCVSLILAGAIGNMIDSAFYGMIFTSSDFHIAQMVPFGKGYGQELAMNGFLQGNVVDMLHLPLIDKALPTWLPFIQEGARFRFFEPIFNIADSSITLGVVIILFFQRSFFQGLDAPVVKQESLAEATAAQEEVASEPISEVNRPPVPPKPGQSAEDTSEKPD